MSDKEDYLTTYRVFFENFAATVNPEDQLPVHIAGYTITEAELPGEVLYWTTQYLTEKQCPLALMTPLRRIILEEVRVASKKQPNEFGYRPDDSVYIALRLMQAVTARVNTVCLRYLDNSMLDSLPPPPPIAQREMTTVSCAVKNSRRVMEDRHVEIGNLEDLFGIETTEPTSFYAVYDGHAGSAAATYCAAHLHQYLVESPHFRNNLYKAMKSAFLRTDTEFVRKSNQESACGGSTAVAVAVRGRTLLAAWAGDSLALLAKRMKLMQLVRPHKPGRQDERERIEAAGGTVMFWGTWRVNGQLAVSRAIGDAQYKPYVTARPEIATVDLDGDEDFVVVACDGLWDFVSEDDVALAVYRQLYQDPDDLKAVTKRLVVQAKQQGSADNISIIVVFLKDPRDIAANNCPPMDLGLDNALANAPPFAMDTDACKRLDGAEAAAALAEPDNGVDNSDSDSEDLGPETAVDMDADDDADVRNHEPAPPTPPAHTVEASHVDGSLADNVAESGEESEDEWNYFKGEGEREQTDEPEEPELRSETPCQDNSAWETSSVDMNSSPLNPDAPVFVPGSVAGGDVLLAESPRKPLPMDDIELPDVAQFRTEAVVRPAELLDLDNCDQLNGHHNVSIEDGKEHLNGNKCTMDSIGFGFGEPDKTLDTGLIQDFDRIQKDTTDFCNIQVFQANSETNPFAAEGNEELFERLKNKERDPMSMSFYQEKDDDTCERLAHSPRVDLNAVQTLPDTCSDDEELQNGHDLDKENISPHLSGDLLGAGDLEPNNDILRFDDRPDIRPSHDIGQGDNLIDYAINDNMQTFPIEFEATNIPREVAQTDTPESHKLLFEQIPEIPDGKSSELGFVNEDAQDESEKDTRAITPQEDISQDVEMESKLDDFLSDDKQPEFTEDRFETGGLIETEAISSPDPVPRADTEMNEIVPESEMHSDVVVAEPRAEEELAAPLTPEVTHDVRENIVVDVHQDQEPRDLFDAGSQINEDFKTEVQHRVPEIQFECEPTVGVADSPAPSPVPAQSPLAAVSPVPSQPAESPAPIVAESPVPRVAESPAPLVAESPVPPVAESPVPQVAASPVPPAAESPVPPQPVESPAPPMYAESPVPPHHLESPSSVPQLVESPAPAESPLPASSPAPVESPHPVPSPLPAEVPLPRESPQLPAVVTPEPEMRPETASPAPASAPLEPASGPAPDIVPDQPPRSDLVTDIDIGIPESRAQEICVSVTNEIQQEEAELATATPPPTPLAAPLNDTPMAADTAAQGGALAAAAGVAAAAVAATAAAATKTKTATPAKKSPTTPKATTKPTPKTTATARTPVSAKKPSTASTPTAKPLAASKTTPARTPASPTKPAASAAKTTPAKPATKSLPAAAKPAATKTAAVPKTAPATKAVAAKTAPVKEAPAAAKTTAPSRAAPAARPAPRPAAARPATAPARPAPKPAAASASAPKPLSRPATTRPAPSAPTRPAPTSAAPRARPLDKKPLTNGDVKPATTRTAPPAPRPTPRAPSATAPAKSSAPKPAPRAPAPARAAPRDADKQTKDLANKRITAKTAPPRTAGTKLAPGAKPPPIKAPKKLLEQNALSDAPASNGLTNGSSLAADAELSKPPPSPPVADNALLPDVIA